ncbi:permease-like cell division protein FtsX [Tannockella kyphosi]|uniref:permease-like cell division protein FtsX n=1 Tax=Tannockella kyphosi TaxID=2899121 RepID=UPI002961FB67|nr:permease-like cell division protein FtsX [Tannockella kyphosi]
MSFSSIFAVMITLVLIGSIGILALNVQHITVTVEDSVRVYVKLERELESSDEVAIGVLINEMDNVASATYYTRDEELTKLIENYEDGAELFESYRDDNPLGAAYDVEVTDASYIDSVAQEIEEIVGVSSTTYGGESTNNLIDTMEYVRTGGTIFIVGLVLIAMLLISNTIKITITTRQTEISIMRMVGASNWYIRLPFMLEGMLIGLLGSIIPILFVVYGYTFMYDAFAGMISGNIITLLEPMPFVVDFSCLLALLGAGVGFIGSLVSIRKFLKF